MNNFSLKAMPFDAEIITNPQTGQEEYDRVAHSKELADLIKAYFSNGILVQGADLLTNELQVLHLSAMSCVVKPGGIIINGRTGFLENEQTVEFDVGTQNPRIDRVVAELNITERNIYIRVLKGVAEADPKPAAITQTEDIYQIPLAQVRVNANQSVIAEVKDERAGYISNVLLNQAPSEDIVASTVGISDEVRSLYGLSVDNANVDKALQKIPPKNLIIKKFTTSQTWTVPTGLNDSSFGTFSTSLSSFQQTTERNAADNSNAVSITSLLQSVSSTLQFCPLDGQYYGVAGAGGGGASQYYTSAGNGGNVELFSKIGGTKASDVNNSVMAGGGGASANNKGENASQPGTHNGCGGNGASANANTGNGGGGGGTSNSTFATAGKGGSGGSGIVIVRYYE